MNDTSTSQNTELVESYIQTCNVLWYCTTQVTELQKKNKQLRTESTFIKHYKYKMNLNSKHNYNCYTRKVPKPLRTCLWLLAGGKLLTLYGKADTIVTEWELEMRGTGTEVLEFDRIYCNIDLTDQGQQCPTSELSTKVFQQLLFKEHKVAICCSLLIIIKCTSA